MITDNGTAYMAEYSSFKVDDEATNYRLSVSGHSGNASDDIGDNDKTNRNSNGKPFSTQDRGNDASGTTMKAYCSKRRDAGWWYNYCSAVEFNTPCKNQVGYGCPKGLLWYSITTKFGPPLSYTRIEIMPNT